MPGGTLITYPRVPCSPYKSAVQLARVVLHPQHMLDTR